MRIAVLADTHVDNINHLPKKINDALSAVDLIIHAGDFTELHVLRQLEEVKEVRAVHGNMDSGEVKAILPSKEVVQIGNRRIGIVHGSGAPWGIEERVAKVFASDNVDIVVYGHSHRSQNRVINGILFFNPGKATESFGILNIDDEVTAEIISSR